MLNFLLYYVTLHVDTGGDPARHCHLGPGGQLYAVFVLICLALIQPLFQRFCQLGFGDVRILLLPFILSLYLHKQTAFFHLDL